jgi:transposase
MTYNYSTVIQSINLYNSLQNKNIIGKERKIILLETFNFSISSFYKWFFLYNNLSKIDFKNHFFNYKRKTKITKDIIDYILKIVAENTFIRTRGIKNKIKNDLKFNISQSSINIILHKNNISFKKVYKQINPFSDEELKEKKYKLKNKIKRHGLNNVVAVDEISLHLSEQPNKTWSKKGEKFILTTKNKSMTLALTIK